MTRENGSRAMAMGSYLALALPVLTAILLAWHSLSDRDIWFHARSGRDILATGQVVRTNHYSYTAPDHPWLNHEWLFQLPVAVLAPESPLAETDPVAGWSILRAGLAVILVLLLVASGPPGAALPPAAGPRFLVGAVLLAALGLLWTRLTLRPELVSYSLLILHLRAVEAVLFAPPGASPWWGWIDPRRAPGRATLATLVWAQVHGFAALTLVVWIVVGVSALFGAANRHGGRAGVLRRTGVGLTSAAVALALTPNGIAGLALPLRALGQFGGDRPDLGQLISELVPLLQTRDALGGTLVVFRVSLVWSALWILTQWGRFPAHRALLLVFAAAAALQAQRGLGFYAVLFVLLHTGTRWPLRLPALPASPRLVRGVATAGLSASLVATCALWWSAVATDRFYLREGVSRRFGRGLTPAHVPTRVLADLNRSAARTVLANVDAAGAVLAANGPPVFIDGRTEAYPAALWRDYAALRTGGDEARSVLARWTPEAICLAPGSGAFSVLLTQLAADPTWVLASLDGAAALFLPAAVARPADPRAAGRDLLALAAAGGLSSARRADLCLAAARTFRIDNDQAAALEALRRGAAYRPDHPQVQHNLGNILLASGDAAGAFAAFTAAFAVNGRQAGSALNAGVCAVRLGRLQEGATWLERTVAVDPRNFPGWMNLAVVRERLGDRTGARQALEQAAALRPEDTTVRERLRAF